MKGHFFHDGDDIRNLLEVSAGQILCVLLRFFDLVSDLIANVVDTVLLDVLLELLQGGFPLIHLYLCFVFRLLLHFNVSMVKIELLLHF